MKKRKKWWTIGIFHYSLSVQIQFLLCLIFLMMGVRVVKETLSRTFVFDSLFIASIILTIGFLFFFSRFIIKAKKEYEERDLG